MDLGLKGRRALVMGASQGLGFAIARALAEEGARLAINSRDAARLERAAAALPGGAETIAADLLEPGAGADVVERAARALGGLDILVCNTGGPPAGLFPEITTEQWRAGFQGLFLSAAEAIRAALPGMRERRWGRILLVTSVAAKEPLDRLTISNALRAGLLGLVNSISREVAADGVTINALLPGYTRTERLAQLGVVETKIASGIPARRLGQPEELGALAAFLASERAGYITGQAIACDGGALHSI